MRVPEAPLAASADFAGKLLSSDLVVIWAMRCNLVIETLRAHADAIRARGVTALYLYGSTARDDAGDKSDVDLFADVDYQRFGFIPFMDLRDYLAGLLDRKVDFTTRNALHPDLRHRITSSAIKVFGDAAVSPVAAE
jgi:predicted nucleotidyltransferase